MWTTRTEMLIGKENCEKLENSHITIVGLGGVGGYVAIMLARAGISNFTLIDFDKVEESNINRQLGALHSTIGRAKAEVLAERVLDINPRCRVHPIVGRYEADHREDFFSSYDYLVDAIDLVSCKVDLIRTALERGIPVVSALGTGNKLDASLLEVTDLAKTKGCPLARVMRRELGKLGIRHLKVVYSPEEPVPCAALETPPPGRRSVPGSVPWVPSAAGLMLGGAAVLDLIQGKFAGEEGTE